MLPIEEILSIPTHNIDFAQFPQTNLMSILFQSYALKVYYKI